MTLSNGNLHTGIVKCVLSGDTLVVRGRPVNGPPPERVLSLAWIGSPRLSSSSSSNGDSAEPFAFGAREFMRKLVVGKSVQFGVEYSTSSGRDYASVFLVEADGQGTGTRGRSLAELVVENGWASVKSSTVISTTGSDTAVMEVLAGLEAQARQQCLGMWANIPDNSPKITYNVGNVGKYVEEWRGKSRKAVVEQVRDGSSLRLLFLDDMVMLNIALAGVRAPILRVTSSGDESSSVVEPYAEEAKFFTESRLLQREVEATILALNNNTVIASIHHPAGNIASALVANGFARINDWAIPLIGSSIEELRQSEILAKKKRLRIWQGFEESIKSTVSFSATVNRIISGDTILVEKDDQTEIKITLSSLRQPRPKEEAGVNALAREYLRTTLIGKKVQVDIDYVKPPADGFEQRNCATVTLKKRNVAEDLISKGYAYVLRHKADDQERSRAYDSLIIAENIAKEAKLGVHAAEQPSAPRIVDASESAAKARSFLPFYQRAGRISAVVEHLISGNKFRMFIPKESTKMSFVLAGVRCPKVGRTPAEKSDPFGPEALKFASKQALQRDVEIEIEGLDKSGAFVGTMWINKKDNLAVSILENGYGSVFSSSADQSPHSNQLYTAENNAKAASKNIWSIMQEVEQVQEIVESSSSTCEVIITEITSGCTGFMQIISPELNQMVEMMKDLEFHIKSSGIDSKAPFKAKVGEIVCARFSQDKQWYRAKIIKLLSTLQAEVFFIDYGNSEIVAGSDLRPLTDPKFVKIAPQAVEFKLSYIHCPSPNDEYGTESISQLRELVDRPKLLAVRDMRKGSVHHVTLYDPAEVPRPQPNLAQLSINGKMLRQGYAQIEKRVKIDDPVKLTNLRLEETHARRNRFGMFEYGDFELEEESAF